jgi:Bacterial membrane protein YfhO
MKKSTPPPPRRASPLAAPAETEPRIGPGIAAAIYFTLALVYFLPAFLPGRHIFGTDYTLSGYFYYDFIAQRTAAGHLPGWVPYVYGGVPLFANPGSTFYPVRWLADLLGPTRLFFPILFSVQFGLAGWGMYLLGREMGCRRWVAFVIGLAFQWTGILTSWVYAGHDGRIIVVSLAPLLFHFLHRGIRTARLAPFAGAALVIGLALLSFQIQNAYYLLLAAGIWSVFLLVSGRVYRTPARLGKLAALGIGAVAFGFVLAAVNFLPFRDYVGQSPRGMTGGRGYEYSTSFSMPVRAVVGLAVPEQVGANVQNERGEYVFPLYRGENAFRLHTEYLGALVLVLVALGFYYARRNRYFWFFGGLALFALTMALGGNTPLYRLYYRVMPGLDRFRAPDLAYYVMGLSLICMAAVTLERLAERRDARGARRVSAEDEKPGPLLWIAGGVAAFAVVGAAAFGAGAAAMAEGTTGLTPAQGWMRFALFAAAVAAALWGWYERKLTTIAVTVLLSLITVTDLWVIGKRFFQTLDGPEVTYAADDVTAFLEQQRKPFRVWAVEGQSAWPQFKNLPMHFGIDNAAGEHGNQLQRYNEFAGAGQQTYVDFHNFNDPRFLSAGNVRYLVISAELQVPFLREVFRGQQAIVYENTLALPRAYLAERAVPVAPGAALARMQDTSWNPLTTAFVESAAAVGGTGPLTGGAQVTRHDPDAVTVRTTASRPALLVLADNYYKDWHARVDGRETPILRANHTFRGVVVPQGTHTVEFRFEPKELRTGFTIYLVSFALLALYGLWLLLSMRRRRRGEAEPAPDAAAPA